MRRRTFCAAMAVSLLGSAALTPPSSAQSYPSQPFKIIVSLAPGGVGDILARAFAAKLTESGRTAVVENLTGGGGVVGAAAAAKAAPDGYSFTSASTGRSRYFPI